jgi:hypothetical protein
MVEEFVKSVDEFKDHSHPSDEEMADVVLGIADFLLEFATLGYEKMADVPALIHPEVPNEDLESLGVPVIILGKDGAYYLKHPIDPTQLLPAAVLPMDPATDVPDSKKKEQGGYKEEEPYEDASLPQCTSCFFQRWMWIHFPWLALANCGKRYEMGIRAKELRTTTENEKGLLDRTAVPLKKASKALERPLLQKSSTTMSIKMLSRSLGVPSKLPIISGMVLRKKVARSQPRTTSADGKRYQELGDELRKRISKVQEDIEGHRDEYDFLIQKKMALDKKLIELRTNLGELMITEEASVRERTWAGVCLSSTSRMMHRRTTRRDCKK